MTPKLKQILAVIAVAAGVIAFAMGTVAMLHEHALESRGVVTEARVTRVQHREEDSQTGHQVQYELEVDGKRYKHVGIFGNDVATDVTADALARAQSTGTVRVRYLPDDPSMNQTVDRADPPGGRGPVGMAIGLAMIIGGLGALALARRA